MRDNAHSSSDSAAIRAFLHDSGRVPASLQLSEHASLLRCGHIDSMCMLELVHLVEELTGVPVPDDDITAENFDSIHAMVQYVTRTRTARQHRA